MVLLYVTIRWKKAVSVQPFDSFAIFLFLLPFFLISTNLQLIEQKKNHSVSRENIWPTSTLLNHKHRNETKRVRQHEYTLEMKIAHFLCTHRQKCTQLCARLPYLHRIDLQNGISTLHFFRSFCLFFLHFFHSLFHFSNSISVFFLLFFCYTPIHLHTRHSYTSHWIAGLHPKYIESKMIKINMESSLPQCTNKIDILMYNAWNRLMSWHQMNLSYSTHLYF